MERTENKPSKFAKVLYNLAYKIEKNKLTRTAGQTTVKLIMELGGFGWLTYGGFQVNSIAGSAVAGISCLILSWHLGDSTVNSPQSTNR
jgi:hypothetical protein